MVPTKFRLFIPTFIGISFVLMLVKPALADDHVSIGPVLGTINKFRAANGLSTLIFQKNLNIVADLHARDIATRRVLSHFSVKGLAVGQRVENAGYKWRLIAENIAAGMADGVEAVATWIKNPNHRRNMLIDGVVHAGIGYARPLFKKNGGFKHYWVLVIGAPK